MSLLRKLYNDPVRSLTLSFLFLDSMYYTNTKLLHNFNFMLNNLFYIFIRWPKTKSWVWNLWCCSTQRKNYRVIKKLWSLKQWRLRTFNKHFILLSCCLKINLTITIICYLKPGASMFSHWKWIFCVIIHSISGILLGCISFTSSQLFIWPTMFDLELEWLIRYRHCEGYKSLSLMATIIFT